ncbi:hypothetical protein [Henriciella marina]|uniref:hypothetical protein n=1 Tax=Henriciella marina TaxID=453851 RepID=UPI000382C7A0|nr:hypothetical protein [Henriciella marina]
MKTIGWVSGLVLATSLSACDQVRTPPVFDRSDSGDEAGTAASGTVGVTDWQETLVEYEAFADTPYSSDGGIEADLSGVQAALPDMLSLSWDETAFDAASGATAFSDLRLTLNTEPAVSIAIDEARVWGFDGDFLAARLRGERLDEAGTVFERLEADGYAIVGAADALNAAFGVLEDELGEGADTVFGVSQLDIAAETSVTSNLSLRPFEYVPVTDEQFSKLDEFFGAGDFDAEEDAEADAGVQLEHVHTAQQVLAALRSISIERGAARNISTVMEMGGEGMTQSVAYEMEFYAYDGISGFDLDRIYSTGIRQDQGMSFDVPEEGDAGTPFPEGVQFEQTVLADFSSYEGLRLDTLAGYLARGAFPGMEERDLMSLGTSEIINYALRINDEDIYRVERGRFDASKFEWLLPKELTFDVEGMSVHPSAVGNMVMGFISSGDDEEMDEIRRDIEEGIALLDEHGFSDIPVDLQAVASWDEGSGKTLFRLAGQSDGFGERIARLEITLPDYNQIAELEASGTDFEDGFEKLFEEHFSFVGARLYEVDEGGYDKLFGFLHELGKLHESEGWGAWLAGMPPENMRTFIATMTRSVKGNASDVPQAADWIEAVAAYFETSGGSLDIRVEPETPLTPEMIEALDTADDPQAAIEQFGISVTHTPE